jgi:hypothetical protein
LINQSHSQNRPQSATQKPYPATTSPGVQRTRKPTLKSL